MKPLFQIFTHKSLKSLNALRFLWTSNSTQELAVSKFNT